MRNGNVPHLEMLDNAKIRVSNTIHILYYIYVFIYFNLYYNIKWKCTEPLKGHGNNMRWEEKIYFKNLCSLAKHLLSPKKNCVCSQNNCTPPRNIVFVHKILVSRWETFAFDCKHCHSPKNIPFICKTIAFPLKTFHLFAKQFRFPEKL